MKKVISLMIIFALIFTQQSTIIFSNETDNSMSKENNIEAVMEENKNTSFIVKYKDNIKSSTKSKLKTASITNTLKSDTSIEVINFDEEKSLEEVKEELGESNIEYIQPNYMLELAAAEETIAEDDYSEETTGIVTSGSLSGEVLNEKVVVGLIDSEIDIKNSELKDYISDKKFSAVDNSDLTDGELKIEQSHATHLAGILAGKSNVLTGYDVNVDIMPLEVFKGNLARTSDIINAINYAKDNGVDIINMSFGCSEDNTALKDAIENASDIMFVSAAGNFRRDIDEKPVYPAAYDLPNIISVTSVNNDGGLAYFSDYGENNVDIAAIGKDIESTLPDDDRGMESGTSMSAAVVTRGLSVLYAGNKCSSPEEYKDLIVKTADKISSLTNYVGNSAKLNIENALNGVIKTEIETIDYNDEFSISSEVYDESTSYRLFASSKTIDIKAGMDHTIALKEDGSVWAWGDNTYGQLGNGTYTSSSYPVKVKGLYGITGIVAGGYHNIAYKEDGTVYLWGKGTSGQLGSGTSNRTTPVAQGRYQCCAAGLEHTMLSSGEHIYGMGSNYSGQICAVSEGTSFTYTKEVNKNIDIGDYTGCDVMDIGAGYNKTFFVSDPINAGNNVVFGMGEGISNTGIVNINSSYKISRRSFAIGWEHAIIYSSSNNNYINYGFDNHDQLGVSSSALSVYDKLAAGACFNIGIKSDGTVYTWGEHFYEYPDSNNDYDHTPEQVKINLNNITAAAGGYDFALFLDSSGNIWGLGNNDNGQLGNGTTTRATTPVKVVEKATSSDYTAIKTASGYTHSLALKADGTVWAWGSNEYGQLGNGTTTETEEPLKVTGLTDVKEIKAGNGFSLALKNDGTLWAWGKNDYGQLGNGNNLNSSIPVQVQIDKEVTTMSAGYEHSLLVTNDKLVYGWGRNNCYQLGNSTQAYINVPTRTITLTYLSDVSAGYNHSVLLKQDGTVYTFGNNAYSKLGGSRIAGSNYSNPTAVMTDAVDIAAGVDYTLILNKNGIVYACGNNDNNVLGIDGTPTEFTAISGLNSISRIEAGKYSLATTTDGKLYIWGMRSDDEPIYGYSVCEENSNIKILDMTNISDLSIGNDNVLFVKNNKVYTRENRYEDMTNRFFVPLAWDYKAYMPPENGKGTEKYPYLIYNLEDFYKITSAVDAYYKLMADIDLDGDMIHPIPTFVGHLDGNNKTISNFKIKIYSREAYLEYIGLFCMLSGGASIKSLNIRDAEIIGYDTAGAIAGYLSSSTLENCNVVNVDVKCVVGEAGGIVGYNDDGQIINCTYSPKDLDDVSVTKTISATNGENYKLFLTCSNISDVSTIRYSIEYDTNVLRPVKIGENPDTQDSTTGIYHDSNIKNISNASGVISFQIVNDNKNWSGILCPIVFTAKSTNNTQLKVKVGNAV